MSQESLPVKLHRARTIAIISIGGIGDALYAIPFFQALRVAYPSACIVVITTQPKIGVLLRSKELVDDAFTVRAPAGLARERSGIWQRAVLWIRFLATTLSLRRQRFDASIFLPTGITRRLAAWQWVLGARTRIGMGDPIFKRWFDHLIVERNVHQIDRHVWFQSDLGCPTVEPSVAYRHFFAPIVDGVERQGYVIIHPFLMSPIRDGRAWPLVRFAEVHNQLVCHGHEVRVVGTSDELTRLDPSVWRHPRTVVLGSLEESARLLASGRLIIGNDSAVVHLGELVGTPILIVTGSSDPAQTAPRFLGDVVRLELPCSPCFVQRAYLRCDHFSCVERLETAAVLEHPLVTSLMTPVSQPIP